MPVYKNDLTANGTSCRDRVLGFLLVGDPQAWSIHELMAELSYSESAIRLALNVLRSENIVMRGKAATDPKTYYYAMASEGSQ